MSVMGDEIIDRMRDLVGAKSDAQLARLIGEKRETISNIRTRSRIIGAITILRMARKTDLPYSELSRRLGLP